MSQYCKTLTSEIRARTGRVGLLQSEPKIGSHTTRTVNLTDFSSLSNSSAAEAPRRHPAQVGDNSSTNRVLGAARSN